MRGARVYMNIVAWKTYCCFSCMDWDCCGCKRASSLRAWRGKGDASSPRNLVGWRYMAVHSALELKAAAERMYVCMYVRIHNMHVYIHIYIRTCTYKCIMDRIGTHDENFICIHTHTHTHTHHLSFLKLMKYALCVFTYIRKYIDKVWASICMMPTLCMPTSRQEARRHACTYLHPHPHTHTYTNNTPPPPHTHTHMHVFIHLWSSA
jgi:hypothetical protein